MDKNQKINLVELANMVGQNLISVIVKNPTWKAFGTNQVGLLCELAKALINETENKEN